ncbi:MAG: 5-formyltetrahydrofolate cyclo-ligase [Betaproteobacteria bacterium]|nr:MAG: 5-formyltetrahydrofolate cyclo-ligase [Betaproteobacteria bacterium]
MAMPAEVAEWRRQQRTELLARREAIPAQQHRAWNEAITRHLIEGFPCLGGLAVGFCWPYRGEPDPRFAIRHWRDQGARAALPVVVAKQAPLEFRAWWPGAATEAGVFGLPMPQGTAVIRPDAIIIPPVGFDAQGYRLGYGGGYFDRTLASMTPQPLKIGVAFEISRIATIHPQPHDIALDFIVTERGIHHAGAAGLALIDDRASVHAIGARLLGERGLPAHAPAAAAGDESLMSRDELVALLNTLLEAERAGAKVIAAFLDDYEPETEAWLELRRVQRDEANNCAILMRLIEGLGALPSKATGEFLAKALAVQGRAERLSFLNRGQGWVARTLRNHLPRIPAGEARVALQEMHDSHLANIAACDVLLGPDR